MADHVVAVTRIHGLAGRREELRELMQVTEDRVSEEPGCRMYRLATTLEHPDEYLHVQEWVHRAPNTIVPEPSGPGDPRGAG